MLSVLERAGLAEVGLERAKTDAARWGMATGATAKLHISMADFRNVTMFIVQVLKHVMAMLCEAKPALTCGRQGRAWGGGRLLSGLCGQVLYCTELCCTVLYCCILYCAVCCLLRRALSSGRGFFCPCPGRSDQAGTANSLSCQPTATVKWPLSSMCLYMSLQIITFGKSCSSM